jgi:murein endopeptidase
MNKMMLLLTALSLTGCGLVKQAFDPFDDEEVGTPIRPLDEPVPGHSELPTPADARRIDPDGTSIFSSIGFYSNGKIWSRWEVTANELWDVRKSTLDNRMNFASFYLWEPFHKAVKAYYSVEPSASRLVVWDISREFGGDSYGHVSHEMGLDADVRYPLIDESLKSEPSNVDKLRAWSLLMSFVSTGEIGRVFTYPELKAFYCRNKSKLPGSDQQKSEALRVLRPWPNHTNHFHFRFKCALPDKLCVDQVAVPKGDGC